MAIPILAEFIKGLRENLPNLEATAPNRALEEKQAKMADLWGKDKEFRRNFERRWQINVSMYLGAQWIAWDSSGFTTINLKGPEYKRMAVDNKLFPKVRSMITRMVKEPEIQVIPETVEVEDRNNAKYQEIFCRHVSYVNRMRKKMFAAATWGKVCGGAYFDVQWDPMTGDRFEDPRTGEVIRLGDVSIRVRSPFDVWPGATCSEDNWGQRVWVGDFLPTETVKDKYGLTELTPDAQTYTDLRLRTKLSNFFQEGLAGSSYLSQGLDELSFIRKLYIFPCKLYPKGVIQTIVSDKIVEETPLDWFGLVHYQNMPNFGSFYGDTELRQAIPRQKTYNRLISGVEEYLRIMKGKWVVHTGSQLKSNPDSEHGEVLEYAGTVPPKMETPPSLPGDLWNLMGQAVDSIDDICSDHKASQGKAGASQSGVALNYLIEEDERQQTMTNEQWNDSIAEVFKRCLDIGAKKYTDHHRIINLGQDGRIDVSKVNKEQLKGTHHVIVVPGASLPSNKTLRSELVRRDFAEGLLGPKEDPETAKKALRMMDAGIVDDIYNDDALDELRADDENKLMKAGQMRVPQMGENPLVHLRVHYHYMKTKEYDELPVDRKTLFEAHCNVTMLQAQGEMMPPASSMPIATPPGQPGQEGYNTSGTPRGAVGPEDMSKGVEQSAFPGPVPGPGVPPSKGE